MNSFDQMSQEELQEIALHDIPHFRFLAVQRLTNLKILEHIALNDKDKHVRRCAELRINELKKEKVTNESSGN